MARYTAYLQRQTVIDALSRAIKFLKCEGHDDAFIRSVLRVDKTQYNTVIKEADK